MKPTEPISVRILQDEVTESAWAKFHRASAILIDEDGSEHVYHREFLDRGDAIAVLAFCREKNSVLLVEQFRLPVYFNHQPDCFLLELCGGMVHDRLPLEGAELEAKEELGVELDGFVKAFSAYSSPGSITEKVEYYLGRYSPLAAIPAIAGNRREGERTVLHELSLDEVHQRIRDGRICDARTIALFYYLLNLLNCEPGA
jgi:nudix-type nucleoside diphosphatase (YffH/AdpP family)